MRKLMRILRIRIHTTDWLYILPKVHSFLLDALDAEAGEGAGHVGAQLQGAHSLHHQPPS